MKRILTPDQITARDARRTQHRAIVQRIAAMTDDERAALAARMAGAVTVEGRQLSLYNVCLIACQAPHATVVGGFRQWLAHGRQVRKGEHGMAIWAPTKTVKADNPDTPEHDDKPGFILVTIFDVSQTDESV